MPDPFADSPRPRLRQARRGRSLAAIVLGLAGGLGCGTSDGATVAVSAARVAPLPDYPLGVTVSFTTASKAAPVITVLGPDGEWTVPATGLGSDPSGTEHHATVLGLRPRTDYGFRIGGPRVLADESLAVTTGPLPDGFPSFDVRVSQPERMEPGVTLVALIGLTGGWIVALDASGRPVWYFRPSGGQPMVGTRALPDGRIACLELDWHGLHIIDPLTRTETVIRPDQLGVDTIHHEPNLGPDGHLILVSSELRHVPGFADGTTRPLAGDLISETTVDGQVVQQWHMLDILDPHRLLADAYIPFWNGEYPGVSGLLDWSHVNSVAYVPRDDSFVISSLNQHLLFKMSRAGALQWVIGDDRDDTSGDDHWPFLERAGAGPFPLRQHSAQVSPSDEHVWIYDNGFDSLVSRATEIAVDERHEKAEVVWSWVDPDHQPPIFTPVGGDFDVLANGNRLVYSGLNLQLTASLSELSGPANDKVFDVRFPRHGGFNALRIASLYPPESDSR